MEFYTTKIVYSKFVGKKSYFFQLFRQYAKEKQKYDIILPCKCSPLSHFSIQSSGLKFIELGKTLEKSLLNGYN